jgi:uncharacterized protein
MSRDFPDWISPARAADGKRIFSGTVPLQRMKRLAPLLESSEGHVSFVASFRRDLDKRVVIDFQVEADLPLICQATLDAYDEQVNRRCELAVIEDDTGQDDLPEDYDVVKTEGGRLALAALVEDELILALPQIPRKPGLNKVEFSTGGAEHERQVSQSETKKNPFAALQVLLGREKQD